MSATETTNPYSILFGKEPLRSISRDKQLRQVIDDFSAQNPLMQLYMITGVRGSGKTVFLSDAADFFKKQEDWIVVSISSDGDILEKIVSELASENALARIFQNASINLSFFGVGLEVSGSPKINNAEVALKKMLESLKHHGKRVLIAMDEVIRSKEIVAFASAFQLYIRDDLPVFLLMTGLYENIEELQNVKNLTFLYRAPRLDMEPLRIRPIEKDYMDTLGVNRDTAYAMARETMGYPYAFQLVGYFTWRNRCEYSDQVRKEWISRLNDYAYEIIWSRLSEKDRFVAYGIAKAETHKVSEVREVLNITQNELNPYRKRLLKRGLISGDKWGEIRFTLPYFENYVIEAYEDENY